LQALPAGRTEHLLFAIEIIKRPGTVHDAFRVTAVIQSEEVPDLVGSFLDDPVDAVIITLFTPVVLIFEACGGDEACVDRRSCKPEDEVPSGEEEIGSHDEKNSPGGAVLPGVDILNVVEDLLCVVLVALPVIPSDENLVFTHIDRQVEKVGDGAGNRELVALRGAMIPKDKDAHFPYCWVMEGYKHIERSIAHCLAGKYRRAVEVGIGRNSEVATALAAAGTEMIATDIMPLQTLPGIRMVVDDISRPDYAVYEGADLIYAVRPGIEMVPAMLALARRLNSDLVVYHLGFEIYGDGGEIIDCNVPLRRYHRHIAGCGSA
jgi:uncharacterized UPF0146 family protein